MESGKKTPTEGNLEIKNLGTRAETSEASLPNAIQEMEERISNTKDKIGDDTFSQTKC